MDELSCDDFLGGRVRVWQPRKGYRAGVDPVWLAASVPAKAGQSVLELGCGVGTASFCLAARVPGVQLTGVELQNDYAELARRNAAENNVQMQVFTADLTALPPALREAQFDHVIANPPYFKRADGSAAQDAGRDVAMAGQTPLAQWAEIAARRCKPKGYVTFIQRIERLPELLSAMQTRLGSLELLPFLPRAGRAPQLFLLRGRVGGRADFRLHPGVIVHDGDEHTHDGEDYSDLIRAVLRDGAPLPF
jgi:tRNA1(Val) A37 N6-methylase TrmN6